MNDPQFYDSFSLIYFSDTRNMEHLNSPTDTVPSLNSSQFSLYFWHLLVMPWELWRVENWSWKKLLPCWDAPYFWCHWNFVIFGNLSMRYQGLLKEVWISNFECYVRNIQNAIFKLCHIPKFVYEMPKTMILFFCLFQWHQKYGASQLGNSFNQLQVSTLHNSHGITNKCQNICLIPLLYVKSWLPQ